jgi:hypothetical protein
MTSEAKSSIITQFQELINIYQIRTNLHSTHQIQFTAIVSRHTQDVITTQLNNIHDLEGSTSAWIIDL